MECGTQGENHDFPPDCVRPPTASTSADAPPGPTPALDNTGAPPITTSAPPSPAAQSAKPDEVEMHHNAEDELPEEWRANEALLVRSVQSIPANPDDKDQRPIIVPRDFQLVLPGGTYTSSAPNQFDGYLSTLIPL